MSTSRSVALASYHAHFSSPYAIEPASIHLPQYRSWSVVASGSPISSMSASGHDRLRTHVMSPETESTCWRSPGLHTPRFRRCIVSYCTDALSNAYPAGVTVVRKEHDGSSTDPEFRL